MYFCASAVLFLGLFALEFFSRVVIVHHLSLAVLGSELNMPVCLRQLWEWGIFRAFIL